MAYKCRFKVVLIGLGSDGSPTALLLTPADSFILRAHERDALALAKEVLIADKIDSAADGSYVMPLQTKFNHAHQLQNQSQEKSK